MIINNRWRFIYVHIPKTAGTTVSTVLGTYSTPADLDLGGAIPVEGAHGEKVISGDLDRLWKQRWGLTKHAGARQIKKKLGGFLWDQYFTFAFVRNPFSRTYSGFRYAQMRGHLAKEMTFMEFLTSDRAGSTGFQPTKPQAEMLDPLDEIDFIGRYETLEADLELVCSIIERRRARVPSLKRLNAATSPDEWLSISEGEKDLIRQKYRDDFEKLGYSLEDGSILPDRA